MDSAARRALSAAASRCTSQATSCTQPLSTPHGRGGAVEHDRPAGAYHHVILVDRAGRGPRRVTHPRRTRDGKRLIGSDHETSRAGGVTGRAY